MMFALACASVIIALAADLLTAVVFTVGIGVFFPRCIESCVQTYLTGITTFLKIAAAVAVIGAVGSFITSILVRRRATQLPETDDVARIATVGVRLSTLGVVAWGMALCGYLFLTVK